MNYVESDSEGEDDADKIFRPAGRNGRANKRRRLSPESDDEFEGAEDLDGGSDDGKLL